MMRGTRRTTRPGAFTLPEVLAATTVLTFTVAALTQAVVSGQMQSHSAMRSARAAALGESLLAEIQALPAKDPQGDNDAGESGRSDYDDIDDYDGYTETADQTIKDATGKSYPETYQYFRRSVTVTDNDALELKELGAPQDGLWITITTTHKSGQTWTIERFVPASEDDNENRGNNRANNGSGGFSLSL